MPDDQVQTPATYRLHIEVEVSFDQKWIRHNYILEIPGQSQKIRSDLRAHSTDLPYEHLQEMTNNALRQLVNDLQRKLKNTKHQSQ